jgi:histidinol phosphatase-like enzyme
MEKYIFLDFDGVINTPKGKFAKKTVANLLHLVERSDAKIIISSTWLIVSPSSYNHRRCP